MRVGIVGFGGIIQEYLINVLKEVEYKEYRGNEYVIGKEKGNELVIIESESDLVKATLQTTLITMLPTPEKRYDYLIGIDVHSGEKETLEIGNNLYRKTRNEMLKYTIDEELMNIAYQLGQNKYREVTVANYSEGIKDGLTGVVHVGKEFGIKTLVLTYNIVEESETNEKGLEKLVNLVLETIEVMGALYPVFRVYTLESDKNYKRVYLEGDYTYIDDAELMLTGKGYVYNKELKCYNKGEEKAYIILE